MTDKTLAYDIIENQLRDPAAKIKASECGFKTAEEINECEQILSYIRDIQTNSNNFKLASDKIIRETQELGQKNLKNTMDTMISLKDSLKDVITSTRKGYSHVMTMYIVAFYTGIALIITAVVFGVMGQAILSIAFGTFGMLEIVTYFVFKPPLDLQSSRANLAQLMMALTHWFADTMNYNTYLTHLFQKANLTGELKFEEFEQVSDKLQFNTDKVLDMIERYSEPSNKKD